MKPSSFYKALLGGLVFGVGVALILTNIRTKRELHKLKWANEDLVADMCAFHEAQETQKFTIAALKTMVLKSNESRDEDKESVSLLFKEIGEIVADGFEVAGTKIDLNTVKLDSEIKLIQENFCKHADAINVHTDRLNAAQNSLAEWTKYSKEQFDLVREESYTTYSTWAKIDNTLKELKVQQDTLSAIQHVMDKRLDSVRRIAASAYSKTHNRN